MDDVAQVVELAASWRLADKVEAAVDAALNAGARTPDLGGTMTTSAMGDAILAGL
jgi:3-isopropylmalate dehydrogenase